MNLLCYLLNRTWEWQFVKISSSAFGFHVFHISFQFLTFLFAKFGEELPNCPKATSTAITQHLLEGSFGYLSYLLFWSPILFRLHV